MIIIIIIIIIMTIIIIIIIMIIIIIVNILIIGILPISGQNQHPSTEHDQYKVAWGSSTCYRGIFPQRSHPQGKIGQVNGKIHQTVSMILFSIFQLLYIRSLLKILDFDWILQFLQLLFPGFPLNFFGLLANMAAVSVAITIKLQLLMTTVFSN